MASTKEYLEFVLEQLSDLEIHDLTKTMNTCKIVQSGIKSMQ